MRKIHFTNKALQDLEEIWNYSYNFWNEEQADKYYRLLVEQCNNITCGTKLHKINYSEVLEGLWGVKAQMHIIFYTVDACTEDIYIIRILHQRMDVKSHVKIG